VAACVNHGRLDALRRGRADLSAPHDACPAVMLTRAALESASNPARRHHRPDSIIGTVRACGRFSTARARRLAPARAIPAASHRGAAAGKPPPPRLIPHLIAPEDSS